MNGGIINSTAYIIAKLMRLPNLIILMITLYVIAAYGIHPPMVSHGITPSLTNKEYYLFIFVITCIGAGGYVYNDIIDQRSDNSNDKRKIVGHSITEKLALLLYLFITLAPILAVLSLVMEMQEPNFLVYYFVLVFIFWCYNTYLQKIALLGNITVAILCSLTVLVPYGLEYQAFQDLHHANHHSYSRTVNGIIYFSIFCFAANLIREIIKDIEDIEGDTEAGYSTLPVVIGINKTKTIVLILTILFTLLIGLWSIFSLNSQQAFYFLTTSILILPLVFIFRATKKATVSNDFKTLSLYWKAYLIIGIIAYITISQ